ncbi:dienelactone hydrolase family protein [Arsenicicoccus dermatophilus]|uniref:dienelactone hydrolase family protein n=1 Tax=Arsenicicoccus dermatophilus TaxID=1076331 RepID=UPI003916E7C7
MTRVLRRAQAALGVAVCGAALLVAPAADAAPRPRSVLAAPGVRGAVAAARPTTTVARRTPGDAGAPDAALVVERVSLQGMGAHPVTAVALPADLTPAAVGGADYLFPADTGDRRLAAVTMMPGFADSRASVRWLAERLASHGLIVQLVDPASPVDPPVVRARAFAQAQELLLSASPVSGRVDPARTALWGYSMGGGGALQAASTLPALRAVVAVFPWHATPSFPTLTAPTLVVAGQADGVAVPAWYAQPIYASLTGSPDRAYAELAQARHPLPSHSTDARLAEMSAAWLLTHLTDARPADGFLCPGPQVGVPVADTPGYSAYTATCPPR